MKRLRARFIKGEPVKYLSHLDILRVFDRTIRRGRVPVIFSQGFNPHPSISFALPLSVGVTSEGEFVDIDVQDGISNEEFIKSMNVSLPEGLRITGVEEVDQKSNIMAMVRRGRYSVKISGSGLERMGEKVSTLLSMNEIIVEKETKKGIKETDIRPNIQEISVAKQNDDSVELNMLLDAGSQANLKPDTVIRALEKYFDIRAEDVDVHRLELAY